VFFILHREEGQGLAEYALIISIIAVLAILGLMFISGTLQSLLSNVGAHL
jgi:Flp pilus assembly pilin Flp